MHSRLCASIDFTAGHISCDGLIWHMLSQADRQCKALDHYSKEFMFNITASMQ